LSNFRMIPLYYGKGWTAAAIAAQQSFLTGLAGYISGNGAPANQQPMTRQYGVISATVAGAAQTGASDTGYLMNDGNVRSVIAGAMLSGTIPPYDEHNLIMLFPAPGFSLA